MSREGLYLKKMFDYFQKYVSLDKKNEIKTHYFKSSRQASMLASLQPIENEDFQFLRSKYPHLSLYQFLMNFNFNEEKILEILADSNQNEEASITVEHFFDSGDFIKLKSSKVFRDYYKNYRIYQNKAYKKYVDSFGLDFEKEDMYLVDIGWGGTMQECIFKSFQGKVNVQGYYLGLRSIYNITEKTKRFGLNFSVYPYATFGDHILKSNIVLSEQLLSAPHGSVVEYSLDTSNPTVEFFYKEEERVYNDFIKNAQAYMFEEFKTIIKQMDAICFDQTIVQNQLINHALIHGLLAKKRDIIFENKLTEGYYTNVGDFGTGRNFGKNAKVGKKRNLIKDFIIQPEKMFQHFIRIKPYLLFNNKWFFSILVPLYPIYLYIKFNWWLRKSVLNRNFYLKYYFLRF